MGKISIKQRDVVLIPFPFSDQSGNKVRPALVLSSNFFNSSSQDLIVCAITSNIDKSKFSILISKEDLIEKNIIDECAVKAENVLKIHNGLILKKIDSVNINFFNIVIKRFYSIFEDK